MESLLGLHADSDAQTPLPAASATVRKKPPARKKRV
jgi:hypothetical protein